MKMKRLFSAILCLCLVISLLPVGVLAVCSHRYENGFCLDCDAYEPAQRVGYVYEIYNAGQLYWFAALVNENLEDYIFGETVHCRLMADIVINENVLKADGTLNGDGSTFRTWEPIASLYGGFHGNGKTISGLYFNAPSTGKDVALISCVTKESTIGNLRIVDSYMKGGNNVASFVAINQGEVINCYNSGTVSGSWYVGGVVARNSGSVSTCNSYGRIEGSSKVGGVVGFNGSRMYNCRNTGRVMASGSNVGGVVGENNQGEVKNGKNTGTISAYGSWIGGIAGYNSDGTVTGSMNLGNVSGTYAGGVVGNNSGDVMNCYNTGVIDGSTDVGGIAGCNSDMITGCYNSGDVECSGAAGGIVGNNRTGSIECCYNLGGVYGVGPAGGVAGELNSGSLSSCYNMGTVTGNSMNGEVVGSSYGLVTNCFYLVGCAENGNDSGIAMTAEQFTSGEVAYLLQSLQTKQVWGQAIGIDLHPVLDGAKVFKNRIGGCNGNSYQYEYSNVQESAVTTHNWLDATCVAPKTCKDCGRTEGSIGDHSFGETIVHKPTPGVIGYSERICGICGHTEQFDFVELEGVTVGGIINSFLLDGEITVELLQDGQVVDRIVLVGSNVRYSIYDVAPGDYILRISKENHATWECQATVGELDITMDAKICPIGDITGDGVVNAKDYQRMLRHINKIDPLEDYALTCGDLTGDGNCNAKDLQRLLRHINKTSPLF